MKINLHLLTATMLCFLSFQMIKSQNSLSLSGTNAYVTFGNNSKLGLAQFTLECWFKRNGTGATTSTGTGGVTAVPLITKGRGESDGSNLDMNYFFGIQSSTNVLCADFEEGSSGSSPGLNHPVTGTTVIQNGVWYHAALTYDGTTWKIYLNGTLEATLVVNQPVQNVSIQHSAIGSALTSTGVAQGYFQGVMDEVRIWNSAKTQSDIVLNINKKITSPSSGLVARWGLDEGTGTSIGDISGNTITGTITGSGYAWLTGEAPYNANQSPVVSVVYPPTGYSCIGDSVNLQVKVSDAENDTLKVKIYGRIKKPAPADFTFIPLPDVQFYTQQANGGNNAIFKAQTNWIVANKSKLNIAHVCQLGDCVQNGDNGGNDIEWKRADTSMKIIEDPATTFLKDGIPYTMNVGNHDQSPGGDPKGATTFFNQYFGVSRFTGRAYWGGNYGTNADNNYQLFSASGIDFIAISLEYDVNADTNVLNWANNLLKTYNKRKAIIISHWIINSDGTFGAQGQAIYNKLKTNSNLFMMLCGHINPNGEARRSDVFNGRTVHTLLSDYQDRTNGGNGWLRIMKFSPADNSVKVQTYSPTLNQFETDANSEFTISNLDLIPEDPYTLLDSTVITNGNSTIAKKWSSLLTDSTYEWYVEVKDRYNTAKTSKLNFFTRKPRPELGSDKSSCDPVSITANLNGVNYLWSTGDTTKNIIANKTGIYTLAVSLKNTVCVVKDSLKVTLLAKPVNNLGPDTAVCGNTLLLSSTTDNMIYLWSTGESTKNILVESTGEYVLKITDPVTTCSSYDTIKVLAGALPEIDLGPDFTQCGGWRSVQVADNNLKCIWSDGSTNNSFTIYKSGIYTVKVQDKNFCSNTDTIKAVIKSIPAVPAISGKIENCENASAPKLSATGINVVWYADSALKIELGKGNFLQLTEVSNSKFFAVQTQDGCISNPGFVTLKKLTLPVVSITGLNSQYDNSSQGITLNGNPAGGTFSGNGVINNVFYPSKLPPGNNYNVIYTYTSPAGCTAYASQKVTVKAAVSGLFNADKTNSDIAIFPNPFQNNFFIKLNVGFNAPVNVEMIELTGRKIAAYQMNVCTGENTLEFKVPSDVLPGSYMLRVNYGKQNYCYMVIKN